MSRQHFSAAVNSSPWALVELSNLIFFLWGEEEVGEEETEDKEGA